jgi:DNA-binding response OmpR family regulator
MVLSRRDRSVEFDGARVSLGESAFVLLLLMAQRFPQTVSKEEIARHLRLFSCIDRLAASRMHVSSLRTQLRAAGLPELIVTEPRRGYRLVAWVTPSIESPFHTAAGTGSRRPVLLSRRDCSIQGAGRRSELTPSAFAILELLARHSPQALRKEAIAGHLGLHFRTDRVASVRAHMSQLRSQLRAAGLPGLVQSKPGAGYWLADWAWPSLAASEDDCASTALPKAHGTGSASWSAVAQAEGAFLPADWRQEELEKPDGPQAGIVITLFGLVDAANRVLQFPSSRLYIGTPRDFDFVAALMCREGGEVQEADLLKICRYTQGSSGPAILRRSARRLNKMLEECGSPFRITTAEKRYGSAYRATPLGDTTQDAHRRSGSIRRSGPNSQDAR